MNHEASIVTKPSLRAQVVLWGRLVRFSHTIFALPFALSMLIYLTKVRAIGINSIVLILIALVAARTSAMSFNRLIDWRIDAQNPRTAQRELPAGKLSASSVAVLLCLSAVIFLLAAAGLGRHCLVLAPLVLFILLGYSFTKRFTGYSHYVLGLALACAPGGVWYAITAEFALLPVWMMLGVLFWVAGFDILYSLQDQKFDRERGLFSLPARLGASAAVQISRASHVISALFLAVFGMQAGLGLSYWLALTFFSLLLVSQHRLIDPDRPEAIEATFFSRNAWGSVILLLGVIFDRLFT